MKQVCLGKIACVLVCDSVLNSSVTNRAFECCLLPCTSSGSVYEQIVKSIFVLCKGMLANGLNHSAIIYCSRICPPHMSLCLVVGVCQLIAMTRLCRSSRGKHS